jgi:hypothetical protein
MRKRTDLIVMKEFNSRSSLLEFLNELDKKYNLNQIIISIVKDTFDRYEVYYKDYSLEKPEDRLL